MKFFVVFACALAAVSAGYVSPLVYGAHHLQVVGAQHLAVIGADGVPVDTAEVQQARAEHSVHKLNAQLRNGDLVHGVVAAPVVATYAAHYAVPAVVSHDGLPLDTAEVAAAKINHFAAHAEALARNAHAVHYRKRRGIYAYAPWTAVPQHVPVIANGVPVETPEVQHAKAAHFAAHAEAKALNGVVAPFVAHSLVSHEVPVIANGVPVDTLEVQHAKAAHFAAKAEAHARNGYYAHDFVGYTGVAHHVPVIANGVPVETPEVQHAKAAHFAAHAKAINGQYVQGYTGVVSPVAYHVPVIANGVPVETPEVQHAKAAHFAAHAKAAAHSYHY
ncbi:PREDICTED: cuticle protein 18.7-like [Nicrophorus vespilloides]|uniref:Cuticle protein 18.7-like n=1 Tax=Nicrophorus vespilloides TaxID=110193 RepID=A0ABM1M7N4_NICVS|nr:PREDICTED: cuticle protein 18.7-like [Nicrophorus vespilloides]